MNWREMVAWVAVHWSALEGFIMRRQSSWHSPGRRICILRHSGPDGPARWTQIPFTWPAKFQKYASEILVEGGAPARWMSRENYSSCDSRIGYPLLCDRFCLEPIHVHVGLVIWNVVVHFANPGWLNKTSEQQDSLQGIAAGIVVHWPALEGFSEQEVSIQYAVGWVVVHCFCFTNIEWYQQVYRAKVCLFRVYECVRPRGSLLPRLDSTEPRPHFLYELRIIRLFN